jgi:hypothetical protein
MNMSNKIQWLQQGARVVLGLVFLLFGLNYFIPFLPTPPTPTGDAAVFLTGLFASGYLMPLVKSIEVVSAVLLLSNRFVPLALVLLAPIIVNIAGFHFVLAPAYAMPILLLALESFLAYSHRDVFAPLFKSRALAEPREARAVPGGRAAAGTA